MTSAVASWCSVILFIMALTNLDALTSNNSADAHTVGMAVANSVIDTVLCIMCGIVAYYAK